MQRSALCRMQFTRRNCAEIILCAFLMPCAVALNSALLFAQQPAVLRMGVLVKPDTVQVGDPFVMTVSVEVPAGARVTWPTPADSNGPIGLRAPIHVTGAENGAVRRETAEYALAAWGVGAMAIALPDIHVVTNGKDTAIPFQSPTVIVQSVLPADTSLRQPKPGKALFPRVVPWWELWWPVLVLLLLLGIVLWFVRRRKRRTLMKAELDPFARAEHDFQRLDRLALGEAGEPGRFVALAVEVLRTYLSVRIGTATLALTSDELLQVVTSDSRVPVQRLIALLAEADAIKFGQHAIDAAHARELALEARAIVSAVEEAEQARQVKLKLQEKAQKKEDQKKNQLVRQEAEEKARLASRRGKEVA